MLSTLPAFGASNAWITPPLVISLLALGFTIGSFWWLQARRGRLRAYTGHALSACVTPQKTVIYLPIVFHNPAPSPQAVVDLRLFIEGGGAAEEPLELFWIAVQPTLRGEDRGRAMASPFEVDGRKQIEKVIEFQAENETAQLLHGPYTARVEVQVQPRRPWSPGWRTVLTFELNTQLWNDRGALIPRSNDPRYHDAMG